MSAPCLARPPWLARAVAVPTLVAGVAACMALAPTPARAVPSTAAASATLSNLRFQVRDLTPRDGVAGGLTWQLDPGASWITSTASAAGPGGRVESDDAFSPLTGLPNVAITGTLGGGDWGTTQSLDMRGHAGRVLRSGAGTRLPVGGLTLAPHTRLVIRVDLHVEMTLAEGPHPYAKHYAWVGFDCVAGVRCPYSGGPRYGMVERDTLGQTWGERTFAIQNDSDDPLSLAVSLGSAFVVKEAPEPAAWALWGVGLAAGAAGARWSRGRRPGAVEPR